MTDKNFYRQAYTQILQSSTPVLAGRSGEVVESRSWKHKDTGAQASLYGAVPWSGRLGDKKDDWELVDQGWTIFWPDGTVGIGKKPWNTKSEAELYLSLHPTFKGMGSR